MKRFLLLSLIFLIIATACNNNKKADSSGVNGDSTTIESPEAKKMQNAAEDMEKKKDELSKLKPLTMDELKAMLPETLMGSARKNFDVNNSMGAGLATAEYDLSDSTIASLSIYDLSLIHICRCRRAI